MIFFNSHKKTGREIGAILNKQFIRYLLDMIKRFLKRYIKTNIYGYITASATNLMAYVFGGKDWSHQKKVNV